MSQDPGVASDRHISVSMFSGTFSADEADCLRVASDFGALIHMMPDAVLLPASAEDVVHVVQYARQQQQQLAPRGQGHSTYGQAQSAHGIVIDTSTLNTIDAIYPDRVEVSGGVLWQDLVRATLQQGFIPPVVPDYLGLSIGGTLALGGVGVTSYRCGSIADQVYELQVVTGEGQLYICSPTQHADLFASMLGGLGQCGIIVKATLKLQPAYTRARVYRALYPSLLALVKELDHFVRTERTCVDAVIGLLIPSSSGSWNYLLEVAKFYTPGEREPEDKKVLDLLHNVAGTEHFEDVSYVDYIQRVSTQSQALDALGIWQRPHPWLDLFMPKNQTVRLVTDALATLNPAEHEYDTILLRPLRTALCQQPLFRLPDSETCFLFELQLSIPPDSQEAAGLALRSNRSLFEYNRRLGGTYYPFGALELSEQDWRFHFGDQWTWFSKMKQRFDPDGILTPGPQIFRSAFSH